ncbi:hypothetical protein D3C76_1236730 [compost metagenome]
MPREVFGCAVQGNVGAKIQRLLEYRRGPGIVNDHQRLRVDLLDGPADRMNINVFQERIGRCFENDHVDVRRQCLQPVCRGEIQNRQVCANACRIPLEQFIRAAIDVFVDDQRSTRFQQFQHHVDGAHPGAVGQGIFAALQGGDDLLQFSHIGIGLP